MDSFEELELLMTYLHKRREENKIKEKGGRDEAIRVERNVKKITRKLATIKKANGIRNVKMVPSSQEEDHMAYSKDYSEEEKERRDTKNKGRSKK